jgi:hypothetical protein
VPRRAKKENLRANCSLVNKLRSFKKGIDKNFEPHMIVINHYL